MKIVLAIIMLLIFTCTMNTSYALINHNRTYTPHSLEYNYGFGVGFDTGRGYGISKGSTSNGTDIAKLDCLNHTTEWCTGFIDGYSLGWSISHAEK